MQLPVPTGRIVPAVHGYNLVMPRSVSVALQDAWAHITRPEATARWIGQWRGNGVIGEVAQLQLGFEEGQPWTNFRIKACESPTWLRVETLDDDERPAWDLSIELSGGAVQTDLLFTMHGVDPSSVGEVGPGWEYYLDQLVLSVTGSPLPSFSDYYPAQREYFQAQVR